MRTYCSTHMVPQHALDPCILCVISPVKFSWAGLNMLARSDLDIWAYAASAPASDMASSAAVHAALKCLPFHHACPGSRACADSCHLPGCATMHIMSMCSPLLPRCMQCPDSDLCLLLALKSTPACLPKLRSTAVLPYRCTSHVPSTLVVWCLRPPSLCYNTLLLSCTYTGCTVGILHCKARLPDAVPTAWSDCT